MGYGREGYHIYIYIHIILHDVVFLACWYIRSCKVDIIHSRRAWGML